MEIVRNVADPEAGPQIGVRRPDTGLLRLPGRTLGDLLALPLDGAVDGGVSGAA